MKKILVLLGFIISQTVFSQSKEYQYYNPANDPSIVMEGQAWPDEVKDFYDRLPARAEKNVRKPVWDLSKNSAGLQLRFVTDASEIIVKYTVAGNLQMPHMPATGVSGVDLYSKDEKNNWLWAAGKFSFGDTIVYRFNNLSPVKREYVLYLPLYNTVKWMQIDVPKENAFSPKPARKEKPIVIYGTSIAQGACASRPGLAWTNILDRRLNMSVINLGFSGNGRLEPALIDPLTEIDARVYVLDCLPNLTSGYISTDELKKRIVHAVIQLRSKRPFTPILFTEHDGYSDAGINPVRYKEYATVNKALDEVIDSLKAKAYHNIYLLKREAINQDIETMVDGTHPNDIGMMRYADAYEKKLKEILKHTPTISLQTSSLIPFPQQLKWNEGFFDLTLCKGIVVRDFSAKKEAIYLQNEWKKKGFSIPLVSITKTGQAFVEINIDKNDTLVSDEAYHLTVTAKEILLTSKTSRGIFNGIQTLLQLMQNGKKTIACEIADWPAFSWRGYMIDVGRNYMPMNLLKQQIDVMARYKFNVFHFHSTEDIAWRFAIKQYPQLTDADNMTRNKGKFYSEKEISELIAYCKERYINFVPEIDMPGHSAAFRRVMKTDMQSDSGIRFIKNILKEICTTYDVPYIHIGADEVKITNKNFIPEITAYIESFGKKVIGWQPGGNFTNSTIRQLWMDDNARHSSQDKIQFIDSRHLYLNHMDPLEAVVTIFNRQIGDKEKGDSSLLGATLCMWNDRRVGDGFDILRMNPVYPGMLAFSERSWRGGGQSGWISNLSDGNMVAFTKFENRLLDHKRIYFQDKPFPYVKQTQMHWRLYGPYENEGDVSKIFSPEISSNTREWKFYKELIGGTIVLRHWWYPLIKGTIDQPKENATFYAFTKIWSDKDGERNFWIGFNNLSRSPATDSPPVNTWDNKNSEVWVNGKIIEPPHWQHGGQKGNAETPLVDEGYEYRPPTKIFLNKGWNTVLVKCPVGSFKGKDWQNPVKWMFTFVSANEY
ncbi:MAG TPA: SGNH/GDSL hydrolase family protein [Flavisolibacter sp.]|jgi:lysophospholipase L1-like esterase|nr:SGNH/GDSL hydrolase family protein [Flavisolibacter sp.]